MIFYIVLAPRVTENTLAPWMGPKRKVRKVWTPANDPSYITQATVPATGPLDISGAHQHVTGGLGSGTPQWM